MVRLPEKNTITLATHSANFHLDDLFSCAILQTIAESENKSITLIRTRDQDFLDSADIVFDVGGEYDKNHLRFDHHQTSFTETHDHGIPFSALSLIWKHFGHQYLEVCLGESSEYLEETWHKINDTLVASIAAEDNGVATYVRIPEIPHYGLHSFFYSFQRSWDDPSNEEFSDQCFASALEPAKGFLARTAKFSESQVRGAKLVAQAIAENTFDKMLILPHNLPWQELLMTEELNTRFDFVVYPKAEDGSWRVRGVDILGQAFTLRTKFPESWRGLRRDELQEISGIRDAIFCHKAGFLFVAKSKESVIKAALTALALN